MSEFIIGQIYKTHYSGSPSGIVWQVTELVQQPNTKKLRAYGRVLYVPTGNDYAHPTWNSEDPDSHILLSEEVGNKYLNYFKVKQEIEELD